MIVWILDELQLLQLLSYAGAQPAWCRYQTVDLNRSELQPGIPSFVIVAAKGVCRVVGMA